MGQKRARRIIAIGVTNCLFGAPTDRRGHALQRLYIYLCHTRTLYYEAYYIYTHVVVLHSTEKRPKCERGHFTYDRYPSQRVRMLFITVTAVVVKSIRVHLGPGSCCGFTCTQARVILTTSCMFAGSDMRR